MNIKLKWLPIEEYNTEEYDWVLVRFIDKRDNFVCVPTVVEKRADGNWYNQEDQMVLPNLTPVCFFDMHLIPGEEEFIDE